MSDLYDDGDTAVMDRDEVDIQEPRDFAVCILNDDYSTMELVVSLLKDLFHKTAEEAERLMMDVHTKGSCVAGIYTLDIAQTKQMQAMSIARKEGYPLKLELREM